MRLQKFIYTEDDASETLEVSPNLDGTCEFAIGDFKSLSDCESIILNREDVIQLIEDLQYLIDK